MKTAINVTLTLAACSLLAGPVHSVNKCTEPDGRTVYSDLPCPQNATAQQQPDLTNARSNERSRPAVADTKPLPPIDFGATTDDRLRKAGAMVDSILVDARDCDWALKVTKKPGPCATFLQQMLEGREWSQAIAVLADIAADPQDAQRHHEALQTHLRTAKEVLRIREFAVLRASK